MLEENVKIIRAGFDAFNETGETKVDHLAPDFELHQATSIVDTAGTFHGPDAFRDVLRELQEALRTSASKRRSSSKRQAARSSSSSGRRAWPR